MVESGRSISENDIKEIQRKIAILQDQPMESFQKNIKVISYLTFLLEKLNIRPIIVGGHAVEIYTMGHYTTVDVDLVLNGRELAAKVFEIVGFQKKQGYRHWYHEELGLPLEIPDDVLAGNMDRILQVTVEDGFHVYVIGIDDLILDRVRAAVYWNSSADREWALLLMKSQLEEVDFDYLESEARKEPDIKISQLVKVLKMEANKNTKI